MRAFIFPGQGSQSVGMGAALAGASVQARAVFEEVDEALSQNLSRLMAEGPAEELMLTENAQPAIMANAVATLRASCIDLADKADFVAGHSLGEYSALCAAGRCRRPFRSGRGRWPPCSAPISPPRRRSPTKRRRARFALSPMTTILRRS